MIDLPANSIIANVHDSSASGLSTIHYSLYGGSVIVIIIGLIGALSPSIRGMTFSDGMMMSAVGVFFVGYTYLFVRYLDTHAKIAFTPSSIIEIENNKVVRTLNINDIEYISAIEVVPNRPSPILSPMAIDDDFKSYLNANFHKLYIETAKPTDGYYPVPTLRNNNSLMLQYAPEVVDYIKKHYPNKIVDPKSISYKE